MIPFEHHLSGRFVEVSNPRCFRAANRAAIEAVIDLDIKMPPLRFYYRAQNERLHGYTDGEQVALAADLSDADATRAARHELRHVWQRQRPEWRHRTEEARERDAVLYAIEIGIRR